VVTVQILRLSMRIRLGSGVRKPTKSRAEPCTAELCATMTDSRAPPPFLQIRSILIRLGSSARGYAAAADASDAAGDAEDDDDDDAVGDSAARLL